MRHLSLPLPLLLVFGKYCLQFVVCATILQEVGKVASTLNRLPVRLVAVQMKVIPRVCCLTANQGLKKPRLCETRRARFYWSLAEITNGPTMKVIPRVCCLTAHQGLKKPRLCETRRARFYWSLAGFTNGPTKIRHFNTIIYCRPSHLGPKWLRGVSPVAQYESLL